MLTAPLTLGTKTYPEDPYSWTRSLRPVEGEWHCRPDERLHAMIGHPVITCDMLEAEQFNESWFRLHDGREFNGTLQNAKLNFQLAAEQGRVDGCDICLEIVLEDIAGKRAWMQLRPIVDGAFHYYILNLGEGQGWTVEAGFDWRFIKTIRFLAQMIMTLLPWPHYEIGWVRYMYLHFSYYQLEPATLNVLSDPTGKQFRYDSSYDVTPRYAIGLMPYTDYEVAVEKGDFKEWEDGDPSPIRIINLGEGEEKTIVAYYIFPPPPPGKGTLVCRAYLNGEEITANVSIEGVGSYLTPLKVDLDPDTYNLEAVYEDQVLQKSVTITEGEITEKIFTFRKEDYTLLIGLGLAATIVAGTLIYSSLT